MAKKELTIDVLRKEASLFAERESSHGEPSLFGVTDGKAVGTYLEHKFTSHLSQYYRYTPGNSAKGIDLPDLQVDIKVTSIRQPQSSSPFRSARQKIEGLGYSLLVFVYDKEDNQSSQLGFLRIRHVVFVDASRTADYQTTTGIVNLLKNDGNIDDLLAFFEERMLPLDSVEAKKLAEEIIKRPPKIGYLTISNALQWRLQYSRIIEKADSVEGVIRVR